MTDFWETYFIKFPSLSEISDRATGEYAKGIEIQRGKNLVDAAEQVLKEDGILELFIYSTLPPFKDISGGKYTYIYHYDGKAVVSEYLKSKKDLWAKSSLFNAGFYTSNIKNYDVSMRKEQVHYFEFPPVIFLE
jgi:NmrA-like family